MTSLKQELTARRSDVGSLQSRVKEMQSRFDALDKSYRDYVGQEDPVLKAKGDAGLMDTKPYFDAFFRTAALQGTFPGLADKVKRYDLGFQSAGRSDAIQDAITIVVNYSKQRTPGPEAPVHQGGAQGLGERPRHDPASPGNGSEAGEQVAQQAALTAQAPHH